MNSNFDRILSRLDAFIRKFYLSQILKGVILFLGFGLLYFLITVILEHFFWFNEWVRAMLFWSFMVLEIFLFIYLIGIPLSKLFKLRKGIDYQQASRIIGIHFKDIGDKLLNLLQLDLSSEKSELLMASIDQKAENLKVIDFSTAIDLKKNSKYIPVLVLPVLIILALWISDNAHVFTSGFHRLSNYDKAFEQPAPFQFLVLNDSLQTFQNSDFELIVEIRGDRLPEDVQLISSGNKRRLRSEGNGRFSYQFENLDSSLEFRLIGGGISSRTYKLNVLELPLITNMEISVDYPNYLNLEKQVYKGLGSFQVPEGSRISWTFSTVHSDKVEFISSDSLIKLPVKKNLAEFEYQIFETLNYSISSSNANKLQHEKLVYQIDVIRDLHPEIEVETRIDSLNNQQTYIKGRVEDDHGISGLRLVYYPQDSLQKKRFLKLDIRRALVDNFYYSFPNKLELQPGIPYSYYFEVFDNDAVNGSKSSVSEVFTYRKNTQKENEDQNLEQQQHSIKEISKELEDLKRDTNELDELQRMDRENENLDYNEKEQLNQFIQRQKLQNELFQKHSRELLEGIEEQRTDEPSMQRDALQQRLEENENSLKENEQLLKELQEYSEKIEKEELGKKLQDLSKKTKNNERNLEQLLEITKRYYIEEKQQKIARDLERLADKQDRMANDSEGSSEKQKDLNKEFDSIQKQLDALSRDNQELKKPKSLARDANMEKSISEDLNKAAENLQQNKSAIQEQKDGAKKMRQLSAKMQQAAMQAEMQKLEADAKVLRQILNNLVRFSLMQEELLQEFNNINVSSPGYPNRLNDQNELRDNFEHIDDSIYNLALRNPMFSNKITSKLTDIDFDINKALERLAENQVGQGTASQQYVLTGANDLAVMLAEIMDSMQDMMSNPQPGSGEGEDFQLQQIIEEQQKLQQEMQQKMEVPGKAGKPTQQNSAEIFEIYKRQQNIRNRLKELMKNAASGERQMEQIEQDLLENGLSKQALERMKQLDYELMKINNASQRQGLEEKRKSISNSIDYENKLKNQINTAKEYFQSTEILNRQVLPLQQIYRTKIKDYFGKGND